MGKSKIEWCDRVWNPVTGCTPISPGCANCYAKRMSERFAVQWGLDPKDPFKVTMYPERLEEPLRWKKPSMVFVCSMSDLFHDDVPEKFIIDILSVIAECQHENRGHVFLLLTKRPERMRKIISGETVANDVWLQTSRGVTMGKSPWPLSNIWLGVTAENQEQADKRIPILLSIPAVKRFISVEPMIGPVDLNRITTPYCSGFLDWVICGGESGPGARPMHPDWARSLRDQCNAAGTPFMFKQWGEWRELEPGESEANTAGQVIASDHSRVVVNRIGKKAAGRLLDGELWDQYPENN